MPVRNYMVVSCLLAALAVVMLALAAHALTSRLSPEVLSAVHTAGQIQLFHAIAVIALCRPGDTVRPKNLKRALNLMLAGIFLFSFSIYFLALRELAGLTLLRVFGPVTPVGGIFLIISWVLMIGAFIQKPVSNDKG